MSPDQLLIEARYDDDLRGALEGAVVVAGVAGAERGAAGGACRGFAVISEKPLADSMPRLREVAEKLAGDDEVRLVYVRANA